MAIDKRYYWGDLRLWKTGRKHSRPNSRGLLLEYAGGDQQNVLLVSESPGFSTELSVVTFFDPPDTSDPTAERFHNAVDQYYEAMELRADGYLHPLVYVNDASGYTAEVDSVAGGSITTVAAHAFVAGDRVLCRRDGLNLYSILTVATTPAADEFTYTGGTHTVQAGDTLVRVSAFWDDAAYLSGPEVRLPERGAWYSEEATWKFKVASAATYRRTTLTFPS
jgi:hypothetical protein